MVIRFNEPFLGGNELAYLAKVIENRNFAGNGPFTQHVQGVLESRYGVPRVLLTHSCTGALEMVPLLLGMGPGDEVIVPSYTFSSTASAFVRAGCKVVFADVDSETMMLDAADVAKRISAKTKLIVPVHYAGIAADMHGLERVAKGHGIPLVEDAAQGLESTLDGRPLGTFGPLGTVSFHETKNLHAGLAGALYINDAALADRAVYIWERGTNRQEVLRGTVDKYSWVEVGGSFYPSELQAAFLRAQLEAVDRNMAERRVIWDRYIVRLRVLEGAGKLRLPRIDAGRGLNYHACFVIFPSFEICERVREGLKAKSIFAYTGYVPLHTSKVGLRLGNKEGDLPVTEAYAPRVLRLPFHNGMTAADVDAVVDGIEAAL